VVTTIKPFTRQHIKEAAVLATNRYVTLRRSVPWLPAQYEDVASIQDQLNEISRERPGVVAIDNGLLVGFLIAHLFPSFRGKRAVYSPEWTNAASSGHSNRIYQDMYAVLSDKWVKEQCLCHLVTLFADDSSAIEGWFWEGFGMISVDALRDLDPVEEKELEGQVRPATLDDIDALLILADELRDHVGSGPTFLVRGTEPRSFWEDVLHKSICFSMQRNLDDAVISAKR